MSVTTGVTIVHLDDCERTGKWSLVRRSLGLEAFGMNVVTIPPGEQIPEHDETGRDQEEVFLALTGDATLVVDGDDQSLRQGTFARLDPTVTRTVRNNGSEAATVLIASAPRSSGYEPMGWA
jgi:quercetin dioxygenase-like cupin family protein